MGIISRAGPECGGRTSENVLKSKFFGNVFWSNRPSELDCDCVTEVPVYPVWSVNGCLGEGGAVTTNSHCDRGLTPECLLRIICVSNPLCVALNSA